MTKKRTGRRAEEAFPGFDRCMWMMRRHDATTQEEGLFALAPHAADHVDALMDEFATEKSLGLRGWLLELIGEARSEAAFDLLVDQLSSDEESLRWWAAAGLELLDTKAARRALWDAGRPDGQTQAPDEDPASGARPQARPGQ